MTRVLTLQTLTRSTSNTRAHPKKGSSHGTTTSNAYFFWASSYACYDISIYIYTIFWQKPFSERRGSPSYITQSRRHFHFFIFFLVVTYRCIPSLAPRVCSSGRNFRFAQSTYRALAINRLGAPGKKTVRLHRSVRPRPKPDYETPHRSVPQKATEISGTQGQPKCASRMTAQQGVFPCTGTLHTRRWHAMEETTTRSIPRTNCRAQASNTKNHE